jgi:beta-galactosidase
MKRICTLLLLAAISLGAYAQRTETLLRDWTFNGKEQVRIPHDWAITGPFDRSIDLQVVAILQNGETEASEKTARSGGLPWIGKGFYECIVDLDKTPGTKCTLLFDGAMSNARVYVNGAFAGEWPYGYNSFYFDVTEFVKAGSNAIRVELENLPGSSRWYPGAGLYRNVHLIQTAETRVPVWGTQITTPEVSPDKALVSVRTEVEGPLAGVTVRTEIVRDGQVLAQSAEIPAAALLEQQLELEHPALWSPETPNLYMAVTILRKDQQEIDRYETVFGVRSISVTAEGGFKLNGQRRQIKGVCLHHDLGPLGAAVNESAIRRQLGILKDMGCDAIRTSHNMPAPELVRLCNELGFMMMLEPFDEWDIAKCENGYHRLFDAWAERDMVNMLRHYRNDPCVVMWSIGNEVPSQGIPGGIETARFLQDICHREDPTRPVTCGMDQVWTVNRNGFAAALDVPGYNYRTHFFLEGIRMLPQGFLLGSETASTVSSRGVYHFPAEKVFSATTPDLQSSSYDEDASSWSNIPDIDFALADDYPWYLGQFVWTGFDYLGEPHPYDTDAWPSHSSYFGIVDLAGLPKDRFWLYRSVWNTASPTLHILPHWTWPGREGETTPVFVYTSWPSAELYINGVSQGVRTKRTDAPATDGSQTAEVEDRYRLMWKDVRYEPGTVLVVAYDADGQEAARDSVVTAGAPSKLAAEASFISDDLSFITVSVLDKAGIPVPTADNPVRVRVRGRGLRFKAIANGDATCLESFRQPQMHLFSGKLTVIVERTGKPGKGVVVLRSKGLKKTKIRII